MNEDYTRIAAAIRFLQKHVGGQPRLDEIAAQVGLSPYHFQRLFRRWVGISPKRYLEYLTVDRAKQLLDRDHSVMDAAYGAGLTGPGRLHDQFISVEALSPGEYKSYGRGLDIVYGIHASPFGPMLAALTRRGMCLAAFVDGDSAQREIDRLRRLYRNAGVTRDDAATAVVAGSIFRPARRGEAKLHLSVRGTNFQVNVWRALLRIPFGAVVSYQQIARRVGRPDAVRAVAGAVAVNPIHYLIPCHRVLRADGSLGGYRGGTDRKRLLLVLEAANANAGGASLDRY